MHDYLDDCLYAGKYSYKDTLRGMYKNQEIKVIKRGWELTQPLQYFKVSNASAQ